MNAKGKVDKVAREQECQTCGHNPDNGGDCEDINVRDYPCPSQSLLREE